MILLTGLLTACSPDRCEAAMELQELRFQRCGGERPVDNWYGEVCTVEEAEFLECEARCMQRADCRLLVDPAKEYDAGLRDWASYRECLSSCQGPWDTGPAYLR